MNTLINTHIVFKLYFLTLFYKDKPTSTWRRIGLNLAHENLMITIKMSFLCLYVGKTTLATEKIKPKRQHLIIKLRVTTISKTRVDRQ